MKKLLVLGFFLFQVLLSYGQGALGFLTTDVPLRTGPSINYRIIKKVKANSAVFYYPDSVFNRFFKIRLVLTSETGYIKSSSIRFAKTVAASSGSQFAETESDNLLSDPELKIFNNTTHKLTLTLNGKEYILSPHEKSNISFQAGDCSFEASSPGVIPLYGSKIFKQGYYYTWQFFIVTRRR